ncbi:MAG: hypothetical protein KAH95_12575 [Spirochaetales bacterium]|nr:hypothetical protein [Spirochaetales bacterium]
MKKNYLLIIILLQFLPVLIFANNLSESSYYHILRDLNTFSSFFPRSENSTGEKAAADFIENRLLDKNIKYKRYELSQSDIVNSGSVTIDTILPGKSRNEIFMIFPLNSSSAAIQGRDGSANLASALYLVEELDKIELPQTVHIVFLGAEFGDSSEYPIGTEDYLANYYPDLNSAFFYFDFKFTPDNILVNHSGTGTVSPLWLLEKSINSLNSANLNYEIRPGINLINRLRLNDNPSVIDSYFVNEYPVIHFEGNYSGYYTPSRQKQLSYQSFLFDLAVKGGGLIPSNLQWDSHYLFLKLWKYEIFISETDYVIFLLVLISLIIVYPFIANKRFKKYRRTIIRHFWNIPVIFFIMFLLLWIGTVIINIIFQIQSFPTLWEVLPFHFLALKLTISIFIFLLTLRLFKGIHFSQRGSFYSAAAMIYIIFDLLILISVDIAFSYYLLPVLIFTFAFTIFKNRWIKFIFLALSISVLLGGVVNIFLLDVKRVISLILLSPVTGNLIITATLIPIALMIYRLQFLFHQKNKRRAKILTISSDILLGIISIFLFIYLAAFNPYAKGRLQPITITENISIDTGSRNISFTSTEPLGEFRYSNSSKNKILNTSETYYTIPEKNLEIYPDIILTQKSFLNRTQYLLTINSSLSPKRVTVILAGTEDIILFDSNYNSLSLDDRTTEFLVEANPELPLNLSLTLSAEYRGEMTIHIDYSEYPQMIRMDTNHFSIIHDIIFEKKISIGK